MNWTISLFIVNMTTIIFILELTFSFGAEFSAHTQITDTLIQWAPIESRSFSLTFRKFDVWQMALPTDSR